MVVLLVPLEPLLEPELFGQGVVVEVGADEVALLLTAVVFAGAFDGPVAALATAAPPRPSPNDAPTIAARAIGFCKFIRMISSLFACSDRNH